jgi:hypothetical protein
VLPSVIFLCSYAFYMANHLLIRNQDGGVFNKMINDKIMRRTSLMAVENYFVDHYFVKILWFPCRFRKGCDGSVALGFLR